MVSFSEEARSKKFKEKPGYKDQVLYAFWDYDICPYILGGIITEFTDSGNIRAKGYDGMIFKPIAILPGEAGSRALSKIKILSAKLRTAEDTNRTLFADAARKAINLPPEYKEKTESAQRIAEYLSLDVKKLIGGVMSKHAKKIQDYLESGGCRCINPKCRSYNIESMMENINDGGAHQNISCSDCESTWTDLYTLTDVFNVKITGKEITDGEISVES